MRRTHLFFGNSVIPSCTQINFYVQDCSCFWRQRIGRNFKRTQHCVRLYRQLRSVEDHFQKELEMALAESRKDAMDCVILANPVQDSENIEPGVEITGEDGRGTLVTHGPSYVVYRLLILLASRNKCIK